MTPEEMQAERIALTKKVDDIIDTYHAGAHDLHTLVEMRRDLAVWSYRLSAHVKQVHGEAGLTYLNRKYRISEAIVDARSHDAKIAMNLLEQQALKMPSVRLAQEKEVWAEADKEALRTKLDFIKQVLASFQQEIAVLAHELKNTAYQNQGQ